MRSPTRYKFRHHRLAGDGRKYLVWASDGPDRAEHFHLGDVPAGSRQALEVAHSQLWTPNALLDEGEDDILDVYFDDQAVRTSLYGRLYNDTPVDTDGLSDLLNEQAGSGYSAVTFTRGTDWTDPALDSGDMQTSSTTKTYTATGAWTAVTYLVIATVASGTAGLAIAAAALSQSRTLADTDTLDVSADVKLA